MSEMLQCILITKQGRIAWPCRTGMTVAESASLHGYGQFFTGCHGGGCGVCKIKVLKDRFERKKESRLHITEHDRSVDLTLACCAKPLSNLLIEKVYG